MYIVTILTNCITKEFADKYSFDEFNPFVDGHFMFGKIKIDSFNNEKELYLFLYTLMKHVMVVHNNNFAYNYHLYINSILGSFFNYENNTKPELYSGIPDGFNKKNMEDLINDKEKMFNYFSNVFMKRINTRNEIEDEYYKEGIKFFTYIKIINK
jgi:hypothetical protein